MKKILLLFGVMALFATYSCSDEQLVESSEVNSKTANYVCGEAKVVDLIAGQHINAGSVSISNDEENLYITYKTTGDWYLNETHVYVGLDEDIPLNKQGNPRFGHFPYNKDDHDYVQSYTLPAIPLADLDDCFSVVTHAAIYKIVNGEVVQDETAFGCGDKEFPGKRWGCYTDYCKQECEDECKDAYGYCYDSNCFAADGLPGIGWGSGLINRRTARFLLYTDVNDCDETSGSYVGKAVVFYSQFNKDIYVDFKVEETGYVLKQTSLHFSSTSQYPLNGNGEITINPENFEYRHLDLGGVVYDRYYIDNIPDGGFYVIPHAKVVLAE